MSEPSEPIESTQFVIHVEYDTGKGTSIVTIEHEEGCPFKFWMSACEYFLSQTAHRSGAGLERALELLMQGALNYKEIHD
jgi:hypothetical protein